MGKIDGYFLEKFRSEFKDAVSELEKKHGISISLGRISYDSSRFSTKMEVIESQPDEDGNIVSGEQARFNANCKYLGLTPSHYGVEFMHGSTKFKLIGIKPRNRKYPIIAKSVKTGTIYKLTTKDLDQIKLNNFINKI